MLQLHIEIGNSFTTNYNNIDLLLNEICELEEVQKVYRQSTKDCLPVKDLRSSLEDFICYMLCKQIKTAQFYNVKILLQK